MIHQQHVRYVGKHILLVVGVMLAFAMTSLAHAQERFKSPEAAVDALFNAARSGDRKTMLKILGPGSKALVSSGDPVQDANARQLFLRAYDARHNIASNDGKSAVLTIGKDGWPFPIPVVQHDGRWSFDTAAGREEILARRIGRNELAAIQVSLAYFDAQNEYADDHRDKSGTAVYAQRIVSTPGKTDGLYWPTTAGQPPSPLGEAVAAATAQGYHVGAEHAPFHGYYYRILTRQGSAAPGGTVDYVVNGDMIGGFALVAYPAQYGNSGIMTFIINNDGIVYQKDLGEKTDQIASAMTSYNPDHTWRKAVETMGQK